MTSREGIIVRGAGILAVAGLALVAGVLAPSAGPAADVDWTHVQVVYTTDVKGHIEPCG